MSEELARLLRETLEALQFELKEARREREARKVESARVMRERCLAAIRKAMPDGLDADTVFSKHALFDVLDEVAGEVERMEVMQ